MFSSLHTEVPITYDISGHFFKHTRSTESSSVSVSWIYSDIILYTHSFLRQSLLSTESIVCMKKSLHQ